MKSIFFGSNLRWLRESRGLKQAEMLDLIEVKRSTWSGYEKNSSKPNFEDLLRIAEYFDISINDLIYSDLSSVQNIKTVSFKKADDFVQNSVQNGVQNVAGSDAILPFTVPGCPGCQMGAQVLAGKEEVIAAQAGALEALKEALSQAQRALQACIEGSSYQQRKHALRVIKGHITSPNL